MNLMGCRLGVKCKIAVWLAILGVTLNALWPLLTGAQPKAMPTEICSAGAAKSGGSTADGRTDGRNLPAPPTPPRCCSSTP